MASRRSSVVHHLRSLVQVPLMLVVFTGMWVSTSLGYVERAFRFMGRGMQSPQLKAKAFKGYQPTERDVFVCTYSKSGTNWAMQVGKASGSGLRIQCLERMWRCEGRLSPACDTYETGAANVGFGSRSF